MIGRFFSRTARGIRPGWLARCAAGGKRTAPLAWTRRAVAAAAFCLYGALGFLFASHTPVYRFYRSAGPAHVRYEKAVVLSIEREELEKDARHGGLLTGYQDIVVRIASGEHAGEVVKIQNVLNFTTHFLLREGAGIIVHVDTGDEDTYTVSVYSVDRVPVLVLLAVLFVAALCGIGGWRGFRSLLGMLVTLVSIFFYFMPLLYRGAPPAVAAAVMAAGTTAVSVLLLGGYSRKSAAAIIGSLVGISLAAGVAWAAQSMAQISGYTTGEVDSLLAIAGRTGMKVGELLFAAFLISTLGAVLDVSVSIASAVSEIRARAPALPRGALFRSGMSVGRDMMGTMASTLILAFVGMSLNSVILMYSLETSGAQILNSNAAVIELVQSLSAGLAVFLTVPAVAAAAALGAPRRRRRYRSSSMRSSTSLS